MAINYTQCFRFDDPQKQLRRKDGENAKIKVLFAVLYALKESNNNESTKKNNLTNEHLFNKHF